MKPTPGSFLPLAAAALSLLLSCSGGSSKKDHLGGDAGPVFTVESCKTDTCGAEAQICGWTSSDPKYLDASIKTWNWIKENLVDSVYGEWYGGLGKDGKPDIRRPKANMWKCPYHNSRMAFELYVRSW